MIKSFKLSESDDLNTMKLAFKNRDADKLEQVIDIVNKSGAISEVQKITQEYSLNCLKLLEKFPETPYRESLQDVVINLQDRSK